MNISFKIKTIALAVAATQMGFIQAKPANAQPMLEEILVTARKRVETLSDAPLSLVAYSGSSLDNVGITNLTQLSSHVPGLVLGVTTQTTSVFIRGLGSGINKGFEQSVGMFVDGIYQARSRQYSLSMVDVQQVEVLRGPQSILFGKNTIAGAIKMETASPVVGDGFSGNISMDYEPELDTIRGTVVLSGDLSDNIAGRLAMRYQESDGWVENNVRGADEKSVKDNMFRGTLVWAANDNLQVTGKLTYIDMEGEGNATVNAVVDPSLLDTLGQPGNSLTAFNVIGTIAAFQVPGFLESSGRKKYDSWMANETWFPGGTDEDSLEYTQGLLKVDWDIGNYSVTSLTGYTSFEEHRNQDVDFHGANFVGSDEREDLDVFSQELRIASNFDGPLNFIAGLYYEKQNGDIGSGAAAVDGTLGGLTSTLPGNALSPNIPPGVLLGDLGVNSLWNGLVLSSVDPSFAPLIGSELDVITRQSTNEIDYETLAVFLEAQWDITEDLTLEIGARYSSDSKDVQKSLDLAVGIPGSATVYVNGDGSLTAAGAADPQGAALVGASWGVLTNSWPHDAKLNIEEDNFDPSVRLIYQLNDDTMTYISWSTGYKSGGINGTSDTFNPDGTPGDGTEFEPENTNSWELGVKSTFWNQRARLNAALYYTEIDDLQVTAFRGATFLVGNAAAMTSQGFELDGQFAVSDNLELGGAIAYLDNEFDEYPDAPCTIYQQAATSQGEVCRQDIQGRSGPFAPEWSGTIYAHYSYPLGDNLLLTMLGDAGYKDDYYTDGDLDPNTLQEAYWKFNARVGLSDSDGKWELAVYARNLTDEATYSYSVDSPFSAGIYGSGIEEPRVYGLQASYNF